MSPTFLALLLITALFGFFLIIKSLGKFKFCVVCLAVFLSWVIMLALLKIGTLDESIIVAILMGQSVTGVFYLAKKKLEESLQIFILPIILTLTYLAFIVISQEIDIPTLLLIAFLWIVVGFIYLLKDRISPLKKMAEKIIACCRDW